MANSGIITRSYLTKLLMRLRLYKKQANKFLKNTPAFVFWYKIRVCVECVGDECLI